MKKIYILLLLFMVSFSFGQQKHKVKSGETIYGIAKKYKVKEKAIFDANPKIKGKSLQIGTVLVIPNGATVIAEKPKKYTVEKGDSYYAIAKKLNIRVRDLVEANPKIEPNRIKPGMVLSLEKPKKSVVQQESETPEEEIDNLEESIYQDLIHVVKKGETLSSISREYEISVDSLRSLNPNLTSVLPTNYQLLIRKGIDTDDIEVVVNDDDTVSEKVEETIPVVEEVPAIEYTEGDDSFILYETLEKLEIVINSAKDFLGTRYRYGGRSASGIDCSGLVCEAYNSAGVDVPRTSSAQSTTYKKIKKKNARRGDLIFFITRGSRISHVGIITEVTDGNIQFIHASSSSGVIISSLNESYYSRRYAQISRVLD